MSSLLAFAWKQRKDRSNKKKNVAVDVPPDVARASSNETQSPQGMDESFESFHTAACCTLSPPSTPQGLRPRPSVGTLCVRFHLPENILKDYRNVNPKALTLPAMAQATSAALPCLPPPSSQQVRRSVSSPIISTSSFYTYSRSSKASAPVAQSPNLNYGQALTAVGTLVANQQQQGAAASRQGRRSLQHSDTSPHHGILPPRDDHVHEEDDEDSVLYQHFNDSQEVSTPGRKAHLSCAVSSPDSQSTAPSSVGWRQQDYYYSLNEPPQQANEVNVSFSSRLGLVAQEGKKDQPAAYDFDPIVALHGDAMTNVSAISQSTIHHAVSSDDDHSRGSRSLLSMDSAQHSQGGVSHAHQPTNNYIRHAQGDGEEAFDTLLMQRKHQNQRKTKEKLVMDLIARLQDNLDLVAEIENYHDEDEISTYFFVKTPMEEQGLLTGYNNETRLALYKYLESILKEMDTAQPEEFFLSPSQLPSFAEPHDDLRQALEFLLCLVQMAHPRQVPNQWICPSEVRASMGLEIPPESPEVVRGGDTSLFSLPSETTATPHTSNVSLTTTITTRLSPMGNNKDHEAADNEEEDESEALRRTIEILSTLLQKMTVACDALLSDGRVGSEASIRATEQVKHNYLQIMALDRGHLATLVMDGIFVEVDEEEPVDGVIIRQVSADDEAASNTRVHASGRHLLCVFEGQPPPIEPVPYNEAMSTKNESMFSPNTEDMKTVLSATLVENDDEFDDLRDDGGEDERDGPAVCVDREQGPIYTTSLPKFHDTAAC